MSSRGDKHVINKCHSTCKGQWGKPGEQDRWRRLRRGRSRPPREMPSVLKGEQAPARWTGRGKATCQSTEHEAKRAPKPNLENMVNGVRCTFPQSYQPELPCFLQMPVTFMRLVVSYHAVSPWVVCSLLLLCPVSSQSLWVTWERRLSTLSLAPQNPGQCLSCEY